MRDATSGALTGRRAPGVLAAGLWVALLLTALFAGAAHAAGGAHVHGNATLDIAVEGPRISLQLSVPLDSVLGFERAPRTDAERRQAADVVNRLRAADTMFTIDPAAQCVLTEAVLSAAALKLGPPDAAGSAQAGHADIDGVFEFKCTDAAKAAYIDLGLFTFAQLQRVDVQVATARGQFKRTLRRPAARVLLSGR